MRELTPFNVLHLNIKPVLGNNFVELSLNLNEIYTKIVLTVLSETCILSNENHPILEGYTSYAVCRNLTAGEVVCSCMS